jgi:CPA1 family monovalent cation:H+ antiporter
MLDPELALALFVAPVLLDAAFDSSPRDLREQWRPVASLALIAVLLTVAAVAVTVRWLAPEVPWAAAVALGAIVAPPDAAAATAVLRQLRPPHRLLVILEGESLFNDASALLVYRLAVGAAAGAVVGLGTVPTLLAVSVGSVVLGLVLARITLVVNGRITDIATAVIVQFIGTFAVWILAERAHLSGILTMVVYAMAVAREAPALIPARIRIPSYAVWEVAVFVLNVLAFILVGLQLKPILGRLSTAEVATYLGTAAAVTAVVMLVRLVWVLREDAICWLLRRSPAAGGRCGTTSNAIVVAWCGMRGTVTLAAALALPADFPARDLVLFTAFCVVLGTLVIQGLTLRPLMRRLGVEQDDSVEREVRLARTETARAAVDELDGAGGPGDAVRLVQSRYQARLQGRRGDGDNGAGSLLRRAVAAERRRLVALRAEGTIGDDAFHRVEEELDWAELHAESTS